MNDLPLVVGALDDPGEDLLAGAFLLSEPGSAIRAATARPPTGTRGVPVRKYAMLRLVDMCHRLGYRIPPGLDLYSEVLLKIQAHYVEIPVWKEVVERGTNMFEVALSRRMCCSRD